jgi:hypothetical protein
VCYTVYLSTTSAEDLTPRSSALVRFEKPEADDPLAGALRFENRWCIATRTGCSCGLRHTMSPELGFTEPEDWNPEEPEDLEATASLIGIVRELVARGRQADAIDAWAGAEPGDLKHMEVDLGAVSDRQFRFFENYHFVFSAASATSAVIPPHL